MKSAVQDENGDIVPADGSHLKGVQSFDPNGFVAPTLGEGKPFDDVVLLREQGREGEFMPAFEDEHGTYIMNSRDLRAIQHVEKLIELGFMQHEPHSFIVKPLTMRRMVNLSICH